MHEEYNYFSKNLTYLRKVRKITQSELAKRIQVDQTTIGRWEDGNREPTVGNVIRIANFFNVSVSDLTTKDISIPNYKASDIPKTDEDFKNILIKKGLMDSNEKISEEDAKKLIEFAIANKDFLIQKKED